MWWLIFLALNAAIIFVTWLRQGPRVAVAAGVLASLLFPTWLRWYPLADNPAVWIDLQVASGVLALCFYLGHRESTYRFNLQLCDLTMLGVVGTHLISDTINEGFSLGLVLRVYGEWVLPYLAGRVALQQVSDARKALPFALIVLSILSVLGVMEVFTGSPNPQEWIVGVRPEEGFTREAGRFGLHRTYGPTMHPIYFGNLIALLLPWAVYGFSAAKEKNADRWWVSTPIVGIFGLASPLSRGPAFVLGLLPATMVYIFQRRWRVGLAIGVLVLGLVTVFAWDRVEYWLESITGEQNKQWTTKVDGQTVRYTGTAHRLLLFRVYRKALLKAGLFGYGTARCSQFPPDVPGGNEAGELDTIDNAYLLYTLRLGYLGIFFITASGLLAAYTYGRLAGHFTGSAAVFLAAMSGGIVSMLVILTTVWMPHDFGFLYLFMLGGSSGMAAHYAIHPPEEKKHYRRRSRSEPDRGDDYSSAGDDDWGPSS
jgi:hypothetical protein